MIKPTGVFAQIIRCSGITLKGMVIETAVHIPINKAQSGSLAVSIGDFVS